MFWPTSIVYNNDLKKTYSLFTYEGCSSVEVAKEVIKSWRENEKLLVLCAYVTDDNNNVLYLENNVNAFGDVTYNEHLLEEAYDILKGMGINDGMGIIDFEGGIHEKIK